MMGRRSVSSKVGNFELSLMSSRAMVAGFIYDCVRHVDSV